MNLTISQLIFIVIEIIFVVTVVYHRKAVLCRIKEFFTAPTHPLNLAIFRIAIFYGLYDWSFRSAIFFSQAPEEMLFVPYGLNWLIPDILPIDVNILKSLIPIYRLACLGAIFGILTNCSALVACVIGLYILGIPQLYGKVNHYHNIIWFAMILSVSPCGHALSIDSIWRGLLRKRKNMHFFPGGSVMYALPIKFAWILIGYLYFSAGFWKWWKGGGGLGF